jgi:DNA-binding GntR family transcriptional regulator
MSNLPHLSAPTLAEQAYVALRQAILDGGLARGEKITERGLAELLNISPTPVREAMRRLEQDRLVERHGPRSVRIAHFDDAEIADISTIESTLRALAARFAASRATESQLQRMSAALDAADAVAAELLSRDGVSDREFQAGVDKAWAHLREFHVVLDEACGSPMLLHMLRMADAFDSGERRRVLRTEVRADRTATDARYRHHRAIFDAVLAHDGPKAEQLMLAHSHASALPRLRSRGA